MLSRRDVIKLGAASVLVARGLGAAKRPEPIGLQLYTVRGEMAKDPVGTLSRVGAMGFTEVEFAGYHGLGPAETTKALSAAGLEAPAVHAGLSAIENDTQRLIDECAAVGHRYLVLAYLQPNERQTLDQYRHYVDVLNRAGEACRKAGLQLAYHNHDFEFETLDEVVPYDLLLEGTDPELVQMELDLYWTTKAGATPSQYFEKYPGRFPLFHLKDMDSESGSFTEVGSGVVDFEGILAQESAAGLKHIFVEQDVIRGDVWKSLETSLGFVRGLA